MDAIGLPWSVLLFNIVHAHLNDLGIWARPSYKIHPPIVTVDKLTILAPREPVRNSSWVANTINFTIKVADLAKKVVPVEKGRESANLSMFGVNALR